MKQIAILGSTGSIGTQTLDVVRANPGELTVTALSAGRQIDLLERQIREFHPRLAAVWEEEKALELRERIRDTDTRVVSGMEGLLELAVMPEADILVTAIVGMIGIRPTIAAIEAGKDIALANKETLVTAGHIIMPLAREHQVKILPVDSEHSAIFQCLQGCRNRGEVRRLLLTCSGGPFFGLTRGEMAGKTRADALRHPNWTMGEKITVDCATLMNKGLEYIEAMRLFGVPPEKVEVVIHRQSVIHSMVEFQDGAILAQLGTPDMRLPIQYALTWPDRVPSPAEPLDLLACPPLTFHRPDTEAFPALALAMECARTGGTSCAVLNGANEAAVGLFLREEIPFGQIPDLVARALDRIPVKYDPCLEDILEADRQARRVVCEGRSAPEEFK